MPQTASPPHTPSLPPDTSVGSTSPWLAPAPSQEDRARTLRGSVFRSGYEGRTITQLVDILADNGVRTLVDVRLNPISRKPNFSKARLCAALAEADIDYLHEPRLGNPKQNRPGYRAGNASARLLFLHHMQQDGAEALSTLEALIPRTPTALLCFERDPSACHRTAVAV